MPRILAGPFAGHEGELIADLGDTVELAIELFGREAEVRVRRDQVELDDDDPRAALRERIIEDQRALALREEVEFWSTQAELPASDALSEWAAFEDHRAAIEVAAADRREALLAAFEAEIAALPDAQVRAAFEAERERWLVAAARREQLTASWRADPAAFEAYRAQSDRARARWDRAEQAVYERDYQRWRDQRWSEDEHQRLRARAEAELETKRPALEARLREEWSLELPEDLVRAWLFFASLQPVEREALEAVELAPFGVMDLFDRPDAQAIEGIDARVHGRFYRDPPEMLTFMHGGSDGLHFGLFFDDGRRSSGVVSYYNNDGGGLGRPHGTALMAVRARLETFAAGLGQDASEPEASLRRRGFELQLLREALVRFETGDRPEQGEAYDETHEAPRRRAAYEAPDPARWHTLDEAGALVAGEPAQPRGHGFPSTQDEREAHDERWECIEGDDPVVEAWAAEARRRLAQGDASEALCLGRDIHWLSNGVAAREDLACELLAAAYRALGRDSLAGIVEAHHRHRDLASVGVLTRR